MKTRMAASDCTVEGLVLLKEIHDHYESQWQHPHPDGPGHCHSKTGHWDADGRPCEWCATWNRVRSFVKQNAKHEERAIASRAPCSCSQSVSEDA